MWLASCKIAYGICSSKTKLIFIEDFIAYYKLLILLYTMYSSTFDMAALK